MNIYIPIEIKSRELESKILLALEAASRGHEVLLGPLSIVFSWGPTGLLKPGIFHDKSLHPKVNFPPQRKIKERGGVITCLDEESGLLDESYEKFAKTRFSKKSLSIASRVFCWGDFDESALKELYPEYSSVISNTGSPRVDLWRPKFKRFYADLNKGGVHDDLIDYIFVVSNFSLTLNQNRFWNLVNLERGNGDLERSETEDYYFKLYSYEVNLLNEFVKMIRALAIEFPLKTIVVRPHPIENQDAWKVLLNELGNVKVIREGSINNWVNNASVIIHNGCTTALEGRVNMKNVIAYRPIPSDLELTIPNSISYECFDLVDLISVINDCFHMTDVSLKYSKVSEKELTNRLTISPESYAFKEIVNEWDNLRSDQLEVKNNWYYVSSRLLLSRIKKGFLSKIGLGDKSSQNKASFGTGHKFPNLEKKEIEKYVDSFSLEFPEFSGINVTKIYKKTFLLRK